MRLQVVPRGPADAKHMDMMRGGWGVATCLTMMLGRLKLGFELGDLVPV